jgi:hypothetical protein
MYEYKVRLNYKVESCVMCPFRHESITHENIESFDKLSGVVTIARRQSFCPLTELPIFAPENVEQYNSKCPLHGNILYFDDKK